MKDYLNLAKEKVAKKWGYNSFSDIEFFIIDTLTETTKPPFAEERINDEVSICCLQLQQEDAEKALNVKHSVNIELKLEIEQLKAELSQAREEKAKAFDEAVRLVIRYYGKVNCKEVVAFLSDNNPYYKQDTQPKDK